MVIQVHKVYKEVETNLACVLSHCIVANTCTVLYCTVLYCTVLYCTVQTTKSLHTAQLGYDSLVIIVRPSMVCDLLVISEAKCGM